MFLPIIAIFLLIIGSSSTDTATAKPRPTPVVTEVAAVPGPVVTTPPVVVEIPTDPTQERIQRIANAVGVTVPISVGVCEQHPGALACFKSVSNVISITQAGLASTDDYLSCIINHENRHAYQKAAGLITYAPNGYISNKEWLEQDAHNFAGCG